VRTPLCLSPSDLLHLSRQSCYLFGRDQAVVDVPLEHTSCSKQHAVLQYRLLIERNEFGDEKRNIK
jgi:smad nuclear-interacting protein 1